MRILYTGGSSGGHAFPIIALHRALKNEFAKSNETFEAFFCGSDAFIADFYLKEGIKPYYIARAKIRRYFSFLNFFDPIKFIFAFLKSLFIVWKIMPDIVFAKGGYDSLPVGIAAWLYRIPLIIHESDSIPGLSNKILSKLAVRVAVSFDFTVQFFPQSKTAVIGNIIRSKPSIIKDLKKEMNIDKPVILVLGGSSGAQKINELIAKSLSRLMDNYFIVLQCGKNNFDEFVQELLLVYEIDYQKTKNFKVFAFLDEQELANYFNVADIVISRAGAGAIFEIARWGKPSILIPLPDSASDHQQKNAFLYARQGAAIVLSQANLTPELLIGELNNIIQNVELKNKMSKAALNFATENAAEILVKEIIRILNINLNKNQLAQQKDNNINNNQSSDSQQSISNNNQTSAQDKIFSKL
jgi:UDP-N-acetylglucosamine--N-acetylmuramyl-(pentapeptide) pyrophosphoryl-undecaprenol N-acetylglucosamine transferase